MRRTTTMSVLLLAVASLIVSVDAEARAPRADPFKALIAGSVPSHSKSWCIHNVQVVGALLQSDRSNAAAYEQLAHVLACADRRADAVAVLNSALKKRPQRVATVRKLAELQLLMGDVRAAQKTLAVLAKAPKRPAPGYEQSFTWLVDYWVENTPKKSSAKRPGLPVADDLYSDTDEGAEPLLTQLLDDPKATLALPITDKAPWMSAPAKPIGFAAWLGKKHPEALKSGQVQRDLVLWLFTQAAPDPMVYEALGDLLRVNSGTGAEATRAAWCYLRAAELTKEQYPKMNYVAKAGRALAGKVSGTLQGVKAVFDKTRARYQRRDDALAKNEARGLPKDPARAYRFMAPVGAAEDRAVEAALNDVAVDCEKSVWGNPRKLKAVPKAERGAVAPKARWARLSVLDILHRFGPPLCRFRGQWLWPVHGASGAKERAIWVKFKKGRDSVAIRALEQPGR